MPVCRCGLSTEALESGKDVAHVDGEGAGLGRTEAPRKQALTGLGRQPAPHSPDTDKEDGISCHAEEITHLTIMATRHLGYLVYGQGPPPRIWRCLCGVGV